MSRLHENPEPRANEQPLLSLDVPPHDHEPRWTPKIWHGMDGPAWLRLLSRNRWSVSPSRLGLAVSITISSLANSILRVCQEAIYRERLAKVKLSPAPLFVIGHPRSGTTLMHELLACDPRHSFASTYHCGAPCHFLLTEKLVTWLAQDALPRVRLPDQMKQGWQRPQEDEIALCNLGQPSPYFALAFPNRCPQDPDYLDLDHVTPAKRRRWQQTYLRFLRQVALARPGRLILKNPLNTCRVPHLRSMLPDARFVCLVRNPQVVIPSTIRLWKLMYASQGLQTPSYETLQEDVFKTFGQMHRSIEAVRHQLPPTRFIEIRYEDLVRDSSGTVEQIYARLELGDFEPARTAVQAYLDDVADYRTNQYDVPADLQLEIATRCHNFMRRYGYANHH